MAHDNPLPFTPAANASGAIHISEALQVCAHGRDWIDHCTTCHGPLSDCDDEPGTLMPQAVAEVNAHFFQPKAGKSHTVCTGIRLGGKSKDYPDDVRVPFPPPEPAGIWKEWSGDWSAACDEVERELHRMLKGMSRLRAAGSAAGFAACIGSASERVMHRLSVAAWAVLLSDSAAYITAREELSHLYQFDADRIDLARMAEEARTYHRRHAVGGAK